jgi:hypothetical protein
MKRFAFGLAILLLCTVTRPVLAGQAKPTATPSASPPASGQWLTPVKGAATIEVLRGPSKKVGKDLVTTLKIKNTSKGPISLLRVDELWYDRKQQMVTSATERYKKPFPPGQIIEITLKSPALGDPAVSQFVFAHANGTVTAKQVKKLE